MRWNAQRDMLSNSSNILRNLVEVEGGKLKTVSGDKDNPDSECFLCVRGRSTNEIFGNPRRLLYPKIRDDRRSNTRRRASWNEALDFIVKRMRSVGPEGVGLWAGHGGFTPGSAVTVQMKDDHSLGLKLRQPTKYGPPHHLGSSPRRPSHYD